MRGERAALSVSKYPPIAGIKQRFTLFRVCTRHRDSGCSPTVTSTRCRVLSVPGTVARLLCVALRFRVVSVIRDRAQATPRRVHLRHRRDFEDRYFLDALHYLQEAQEVQNVGVCGFGAAPLALARKNGLSIVSNLVRFYDGTSRAFADDRLGHVSC